MDQEPNFQETEESRLIDIELAEFQREEFQNRRNAIYKRLHIVGLGLEVFRLTCTDDIAVLSALEKYCGVADNLSRINAEMLQELRKLLPYAIELRDPIPLDASRVNTIRSRLNQFWEERGNFSWFCIKVEQEFEKITSDLDELSQLYGLEWPILDVQTQTEANGQTDCPTTRIGHDPTTAEASTRPTAS